MLRRPGWRRPGGALGTSTKQACLEPGKRPRPSGRLAEHSSRDNGCLGILRMKKVGWLPESTHSHPPDTHTRQVVPSPKMERRGPCFGGGVERDNASKPTVPHLPLLLRTLILSSAPESLPDVPSLCILGESCSLCSPPASSL